MFQENCVGRLISFVHAGVTSALRPNRRTHAMLRYICACASLRLGLNCSRDGRRVGKSDERVRQLRWSCLAATWAWRGGRAATASPSSPRGTVRVRLTYHPRSVTYETSERLGHVGVFKPGDESHSLMCEPVSHWRALRSRSSRLAPGESILASLRRRCKAIF
jgi:hypothetical protein